MFRRVLLSLFVALAVLTAAPAPEVRAQAPAGKAAASYSVLYRRPGATAWTQYGTYPGSDSASRAAQKLYADGYEVQVLARTTLSRVPPRPPTGTLPGRDTVTYAQVQQVFRWMAGQGDIAFRYPTDGCYARAHLMVKRMQQKGYRPAKVWSFANGESLYARTKAHPRGYVTWGYHVAPVLRVQLSDGKQRWYVIDPSLFHGPGTISQWKGRQRRPGPRYSPYVTLTRIGQAPKAAHGKRVAGSGYWPGPDPKEGLDAHAVKMMRQYKPYQGKWPPRHLADDDGPAVQPADRPAPLALPARRQVALAA